MIENKRFNDFRGYKRFDNYFDDYMQLWTVSDNENDNMLYPCTSENMANEFCNLLNGLNDENKKLKEKIEKLQRFEHTGEHIRLSINIETGKLQRHIYATGQWFGDFDRVLCTNWISEEEYQRFIDRVIEVYNTEFKKELQK